MGMEAMIEAVLFWRAEPVAVSELAEWLGASEAEVNESLTRLEQNLNESDHSPDGRGIRLLRKDDEVMLGTASAASDLITRLTKEELSRELGRAGLETLTIVLYRGPVSRAQIDYLRGVNSTYILRHLQVRGLGERVVNPDDARSFLYRPTFQLLQHLGLTRVEDPPDFAAISSSLTETESGIDSLKPNPPASPSGR